MKYTISLLLTLFLMGSVVAQEYKSDSSFIVSTVRLPATNWVRTAKDTIGWVAGYYHKPEIDTVTAIFEYSNSGLQEMVGSNNGIRYEYQDYDYSVKWMQGYIVREKKWLDGTNIGYKQATQYLDRNKQPLSKNIIVWQTR